MRILITGTSGYVGSNLVKYLSTSGGYKVFALVRPTSDTACLKSMGSKVEILEYDLTPGSIERAVVRAHPDVVVHLAALMILSPQSDQIQELINANILFGTLLVDAMVHHDFRALVNTGTFWEHMKDAQEYCPVNLYASSKRAFRDILKYYECAEYLRYITLELYSVYGPYDPRPKVLSLFKKSLTACEPVKLSPGKQELDLVHVYDVVRAYEKAMWYVYSNKKFSSATIPIGSGKALSLRKVAKVYEDCIKQPLNIEWEGISYRPREVMKSVANLGPARELLGWQPDFDISSGITHMLREEQGRQNI